MTTTKLALGWLMGLGLIAIAFVELTANSSLADEKHPQGTSIDLLTLCDPARDTLSGVWSREGPIMICEGSYPSLLQIPYAPPEEYDLALEVQRIAGEDSINVGLVVGGRQCHATFDAFPGDNWRSDVGVVNGVNLEKRENTVRGAVIPLGTPATIVCSVRKVGQEYQLRAVCNERVIFTWQGDPRRLSMFSYFVPVERNLLSLAVWASVVRVNRMELIPLKKDLKGSVYQGKKTAYHAPRKKRGEPLPSNTSVDMLAAVDVAQDGMRGRWQRKGDALVTSGNGPAVFSLPVAPEGSYQLELEFTLASDKHGLDLILPVGSARCDLAIGQGSGIGHCLQMVDHKDGLNNPTATRPGTLLRGHRYRLLIDVNTSADDAAVKVALDGRTIVRWKGSVASLSLPPALNYWLAFDSPTIGLIGGGEPLTVHSAKYRTMSGRSFSIGSSPQDLPEPEIDGKTTALPKIDAPPLMPPRMITEPIPNPHFETVPRNVRTEDRLPADAVWECRKDNQLNGKLDGDIRSQLWRIRCINDRIFGYPADDEPDRARLAGEVVVGKVPVVSWRQDNSNYAKYSQFWTGIWKDKNHIVGTWHDTEGQVGDFILTRHDSASGD